MAYSIRPEGWFCLEFINLSYNNRDIFICFEGKAKTNQMEEKETMSMALDWYVG